ncbi:PPOX class F420-dependent oxidoreductase [Mangrovimicrobium sediminis]|uniref:PPOX class F420-dependent oxidoreductase n=1 Tax=Mangrovimicrobium sediminis TaxID=2562682 RepID=UPI0014368FB8|nr:PPOX class F420-dependent oxidoreductase [Haliea sp. SAOS-164]
MADEGVREALQRAKYVSFSTLRRNGNWVDTPVWCAPDADCLYIFSAGEAGKVKRLRNFAQCRLATCTFNGRLTGDWHTGKAWLIDDAEEAAVAHRALLRKYGLQMRAADFGARLSGRLQRRRYIGVRLD